MSEKFQIPLEVELAVLKSLLESVDELATNDFTQHFLGEEVFVSGANPAEWWIEFRMPRISDTTFNAEKYRRRDFRKFVGNKLLCEISNGDLNRYVNKRLSEGACAWSINKEVQVWSLILRKAKLWHRLRDDYEPLSTKVSDVGRVVSREELQNLARIAQQNEMWHAVFYVFVLAANTGLRGGEIKKLRIGAIDN